MSSSSNDPLSCCDQLDTDLAKPRRMSITTQSKSLSSFQKNVLSNYEKHINKTCSYLELNKLNPHLEKLDEDILYHIALGNKSHDLQKMFKDIKFIVMGGTPKRMEQFAYFIMNKIGYELEAGTILNDISKHSHRYAMYKVGPILSVSHGMGMPSIGILLHELIKLVHYAGIKDPTFIRIGTCGGFGRKGGTVVVSDEVINDFMEPVYQMSILGTTVRFPALLNKEFAKEISSFTRSEDNFETIIGRTYCTNYFYEGSGRADGAICEFSKAAGMNYYQTLKGNNVVNVEMESLAFAALTCRAGIKSAVICVILSDRLETDQTKQTKEVLEEWQSRPQKLLARYIECSLSISKPEILPTTRMEIKPTLSTKSPKKTEGVPPCAPVLCSDITKLVEKSAKKKSEPRSTSLKSSEILKPNEASSSCGSIRCFSSKDSPATESDRKMSTKSVPLPPTSVKSEKKTSRTLESGGISGTCLPCLSLTKSAKKPSDPAVCTPLRCPSLTEPEKESTTTLKLEIKTSTPFPGHQTAKPAMSSPWHSCYKACGISSDQNDVKSKSTPEQIYKAKDFDSSTKSPITDESKRSFYTECLKKPFCFADPTSSPEPKLQKVILEKVERVDIKAEEEIPCCSEKTEVRSVSETRTVPAVTERKSVPTEVDDPHQLGPCCRKDFKKESPQPVTVSKIGSCCSTPGKDLESPLHYNGRDSTALQEPYTKQEPEVIGRENIKVHSSDCPLFIKFPCNLTPYADSNLQKMDQSSKILMSSPETPDVTKTREEPIFMVSTPIPSSAPKKSNIPCCKTAHILGFETPKTSFSKLSNKGPCCAKLPVTDSEKKISVSINEKSECDGSFGPCAVCKKNLQASGSTSSSPQPDLKDEC